MTADDPELPPPGTSAWYIKNGVTSHGRWLATCFIDDRYADGAIVDDPRAGDPTVLEDAYVLWNIETDRYSNAVIWINPQSIPGAPSLWLVAIDDPSDSSAVCLAAFATDHFAPGTVITNATFFSAQVGSEEQCGAIRWARDGVVDQLFVAPELRGRRLGTALIYYAAAYHKHLGLETVLRSDGRRTTAGVELVEGFQHPDRIAPLTHVMPPMDPEP